MPNGEQKFAPDPFGRDRVISRSLADDPADIGQRLGAPADRHRSARLGWRGVEVSVGDTQQPGPNLFVRGRARIGVGLGNRCGHGLRLGGVLVVLDELSGISHVKKMARRGLAE